MSYRVVIHPDLDVIPPHPNPSTPTTATTLTYHN